MVDSNLKTILACPRDRAALRCEGNNLICREGHAFSYSVLQHFSKDNARDALRSIAFALKPNGIALIQMPNKFRIRSIYHLARPGFREGKNFEVRYWSPFELLTTFKTIFGSAELSVDGYFGLGIQASDVRLLPRKYRVVVHASELLRRLAQHARWMRWFADSLYIKSVRRATAAS